MCYKLTATAEAEANGTGAPRHDWRGGGVVDGRPVCGLVDYLVLYHGYDRERAKEAVLRYDFGLDVDFELLRAIADWQALLRDGALLPW